MTPPLTEHAREGTPIRRLGVVVRRDSPVDESIAELCSAAEAHGVTLLFEDHAQDVAGRSYDRYEDPADVDAVLAVGGDGTFLRAARDLVGRPAPLLGVNLGHLGFLTSAGAGEIGSCLRRLAEGDYHTEARFTLETHLLDDEQGISPFVGLNDAVIHTDGVARVVRLNMKVGLPGQEEDIGGFSGDGIIVATPTGSTAYSLSAGGPIVMPSMEAMLLTAICPHTMTVRPLIVPADTSVIIRSVEPHPSLVLTVDGQVATRLPSLGGIRVSRGPDAVTVVRLQGRTFFRTLRRKLRWASRPEDAPGE